MKFLLPFILIIILVSCQRVELKPHAEIYLMAGQSNMAGRASITEIDTNTTDRIIFLDEKDKWRIAEEPLHRLEKLQGLDCGLAFAQERLKSLPPGSQIALIPCAVGGSSIKQWLTDAYYRKNQLYSNVLRKYKIAGRIDGVLWMQGENDANDSMINLFREDAFQFFQRLSNDLGNPPIYVAELPSFQGRYADSINSYLRTIPNLAFVQTSDLSHKGDTLHFDSESQRKLGIRFAKLIDTFEKDHTR